MRAHCCLQGLSSEAELRCGAHSVPQELLPMAPEAAHPVPARAGSAWGRDVGTEQRPDGLWEKVTPSRLAPSWKKLLFKIRCFISGGFSYSDTLQRTVKSLGSDTQMHISRTSELPCSSRPHFSSHCQEIKASVTCSLAIPLLYGVFYQALSGGPTRELGSALCREAVG